MYLYGWVVNFSSTLNARSKLKNHISIENMPCILLTNLKGSDPVIKKIRARFAKEDDNPPWKVDDIHMGSRRTFHVIQDANLLAGTKQRVAVKYAEHVMSEMKDLATLCYTGTYNGYGALACAYAAKKMSLASVVCLSRIGTGQTIPMDIHTIMQSRQIKTLMAFDAKIYICDDWKEARQMTYSIAHKEDWTPKKGFVVLPMGLGTSFTVRLLAGQLKKASNKAKMKGARIWLVAGSGTIAKSLAMAFPNSELFLYLTGGGKYVKEVKKWASSDVERIHIVNDWPLPDKKNAEGDVKGDVKGDNNGGSSPLYYNSIVGYDYNVLPYVIQYGKDGDFIYNVGGTSF